ncbi:MAG: TonB family protein [Candidatus Coatesbacteria bacterium]|nr:MAG: TonB family protein [Candidatus Coatesbacteria bacterium]
MYDSDYDSDGSYTYRERRLKWLWYVATFAAGVLVGALVFGRGCPGGPEEEPEAETVAVAETAAEIPEPPPPPEPEPAETASTAEEEAIVFEEPAEPPPPRFTPARPPTTTKPSETPREVTPRLTGKGLTPSQINATITKRRSGIQSEYNALLKSNPHLGGGKIVVRFTIAADGRVTSAEVLSDTVGNAELSSAIVRRVRSWKFPRAGGESTVIYPFVFVSTGV